MLLLSLAAKVTWPNMRDCFHLCVSGLGIQAIYLGGVWYAIAKGLPAGVAALIVNLQPVLIAALAFTIGERLSKRQWWGVALGFGGAVMVIMQRMMANTSAQTTAHPELAAIMICILALLGITAGTLYQKRFVPQFDLRCGQVIQFCISCLATIPFALLFEGGRMVWNVPLTLSMLWSVFILSGVGISIMFYMLRNGLATKVTSTMYVVPGVTALMAWVLFNERLTILALLGMLVTLFGVWLVVKTPSSNSKVQIQ
jgi:drug/metabolite transporter (DMT)-like permease